MKTQLVRILAGLAMAIAIFSAPQTASAAPLVQRTINVTYCWTLTTFGPNGCNANWPTEPLVFTGNGNQGPLYYGLGTSDAMTGTWEGSAKINDPKPDQPGEVVITLMLKLDGDKVTGSYKTPMRELQLMRLNGARTLMLTTGLPVKAIAPITGLNDEYQLSRLFRRHFRISPREMRARLNRKDSAQVIRSA